METYVKRIYRFKFYLNASHYVTFNGKVGQTHPHTWQFEVMLQVFDSENLQFKTYEDALGAVLEPYQNQVLNTMAPFDTVVPTLENLVVIFGERMREAARPVGALLLTFEGAETPARSFLLDYTETHTADSSAFTSDADAAGQDSAQVFSSLLQDL